MTDTLRQECEALIYKLSLCESSTVEDNIEPLLAFARAQQAKALREAAMIVLSYQVPNDGSLSTLAMNNYLNEISEDILKAQATAREKEEA